MARKPRSDVAGVHHVYARGNDRRRIFDDDADRHSYLRTLSRVVQRHRWHCLAYCLMENHIHLLLETQEGNLGRGMQRLHGRYAGAYNDRHRRSGHVFQGRFGSVLVETDEQLWHTVGYIVRNPVEAGQCARPEQWPWSSHRATLAGPWPDWLDVPRLLSYFATAGGQPIRKYEELVGGRVA
jgi:putative transposase